MTELTARLSSTLADRYIIKRELGAGGWARSIWPRTSSIIGR
jgi:hypothetical protein